MSHGTSIHQSQDKCTKPKQCENQVDFYWLVYALGESHSHVKVWHLTWDLFTLWLYTPILFILSTELSHDDSHKTDTLLKKNETKYSEAEKAASGWFRSQHVLFRDDSGSICCELIILRTRDHLRSQIKPLLVATCYRKIARKNECCSRCSFWINMRATCPSPLTHTPPHAVWRLSYWWNVLCPPLLA